MVGSTKVMLDLNVLPAEEVVSKSEMSEVANIQPETKRMDGVWMTWTHTQEGDGM